MNETISCIALMFAVAAFIISVKNLFSIVDLERHAVKLHLLVNEVIETVKAQLECNMQFVKSLREEISDDGHTVRNRTTTRKTRSTSNK